jgi:uncharacterized membrane protein
MIEIIPNWHPVFVHFPIAFTTAAVFFFTVAQLFKEKPWAAQCLMTGRWMLWGAAIFAGIAAVFGWFAYNSVNHDEAGHLAMTTHAYWALSALGALVLLAALDLRSKHFAGSSAYGFLVLLIAAWLLVVSTAWHGAEVVFRHGLGVISLPKAEGQGHSHEHGEGHDHGDMHEHGEDTPLDDVHAHSHDDIANGAGSPPRKAGHTHPPGTPPHKD